MPFVLQSLVDAFMIIFKENIYAHTNSCSHFYLFSQLKLETLLLARRERLVLEHKRRYSIMAAVKLVQSKTFMGGGGFSVSFRQKPLGAYSRLNCSSDLKTTMLRTYCGSSCSRNAGLASMGVVASKRASKWSQTADGSCSRDRASAPGKVSRRCFSISSIR